MEVSVDQRIDRLTSTYLVRRSGGRGFESLLRCFLPFFFGVRFFLIFFT